MNGLFRNGVHPILQPIRFAVDDGPQSRLDKQGVNVLEKRFAIIVLLVISVIIYGSLYPFAFHWPAGGGGPIRTLLASWSERPGRADFLANILLYMPLGFFAVHALPPNANQGIRFSIAFALGTGLSIAMELTQYYDSGRVCAASDVYANVLGTTIGAVVATFASWQIGSLSANFARNHEAPLLLLAAWAADRLYPFVPVIDLHKYWAAVKPLFHFSRLDNIEVFRHVAIWSTVFILVDEVAEGKRSMILFLALAFLLITGQVFVIDGTLSWPELIGITVALLWGLATTPFPRFRFLTVLILFATYVLVERLEPFTFGVLGKQFEWVPFVGFLRGSISVDVLSFLEKLFFYGALIWMVAKVGMRIWNATFFVGGSLFLTSVAQVYLPGRSAEITDALLALAAGATMSLLADHDWRSSAREFER
jgi:VanZ family protein